MKYWNYKMVSFQTTQAFEDEEQTKPLFKEVDDQTAEALLEQVRQGRKVLVNDENNEPALADAPNATK